MGSKAVIMWVWVEHASPKSYKRMHAQKRGTSIVDHFFTTKFILRLILTVDARSTGTRTFKSNPLQRQIVCHPTSVIFNRSTMSAGPNVGRSSTLRRFEYERSSTIRSARLSNPPFFFILANRQNVGLRVWVIHTTIHIRKPTFCRFANVNSIHTFSGMIR